MGQGVREKGTPEKVRHVVVPAHRCLQFSRATLLPRSMGVKVNCGQEKPRVLQYGQHTSPAPRLAHHDLGDQVGCGNMTWEIKSADLGHKEQSTLVPTPR